MVNSTVGIIVGWSDAWSYSWVISVDILQFPLQSQSMSCSIVHDCVKLTPHNTSVLEHRESSPS